MEIIPADEINISYASTILLEATNWIIKRGNPLWKPEYFTIEKLLHFVHEKELFLVKENNEFIGTFILTWKDTVFWPEIKENNSAFLHKLAILRKVSGQGMGKQIINCVKNIAKQADKKYLRLDCDSERPKLCLLYESMGFIRYKPDIRMEQYIIARYEMSL
jgi:GNAT superfamily N-acetyltransferase